MPRDGFEVLIEFTQSYDDGIRVLKRGVDATPVLVRKFEIAPGEVMAFSNAEGGRRAITAFHFHPGFSNADRRAYMRNHDEGHQMARAAAPSQAVLPVSNWVAARDRTVGLFAGAFQVVSALALGFVNGHFR